MANEDNLIIEGMKSIARARGVKFDYVIESLAEALRNGVKRKFGKGVESEVSVNKSTGEIRIYTVKKVVDSVQDPDIEISIDDARQEKPKINVGDEFRRQIPIGELGRTAIESVKQTLTQRVSEAERNRIMTEYDKKVGEIVKGIVKVVSRNEILVDLGPVEATIPSYGIMRTEHYRLDSPIRAVVSRVDRAQWGPKIILSRTDPKFLERLLFYEIPEIKDGLIQVIKIVREPGVRAKVAVQTLDLKIDPIGACVGYRGSRIQSIVKELSGERIDIIQWSKESNLQVSRSLSPAKIKEVISLDENHVLAVVTDEDYSKAIGKNGVNVDLASKLCGVEIEIRKHSEHEQELKEKELAKVRIEDIKGLKPAVRKTMVEKGYSNVLAVLKAPIEELKFLLKLDDDGVANILDTLHSAKQVAVQIEELEKTARAKAAAEEEKARLEQEKGEHELAEPDVKPDEVKKETEKIETKPKKSVTKKKKTEVKKTKKTKKTKGKVKQVETEKVPTGSEKEKYQEEVKSTDEIEVDKGDSDNAEEKGT
jgi:N utilization substance protein A